MEREGVVEWRKNKYISKKTMDGNSSTDKQGKQDKLMPTNK